MQYDSIKFNCGSQVLTIKKVGRLSKVSIGFFVEELEHLRTSLNEKRRNLNLRHSDPKFAGKQTVAACLILLLDTASLRTKHL
eukprot:snap_masked-scaffold_7-processed-gene-1.31-mRNA-1 protein AED:1.00 eAED:1.00 QI:0/0/0/0/1/1/2/0/82